MRAWRTVFVLAVALHAAASAEACPACNIHNHLAKSVASSANIVVGKLATNLGNWRIKVEVVRSLRGSYRPRQVVEMRAGAEGEDVGKVFLFSDPPTSNEPNFPMLQMECEDEVLFLLRLISLEKKPGKGNTNNWMTYSPVSAETLRAYKVRDVDEAIRRLQGWSNESKEVGMEYLHECKPLPSGKLIEATESIRKDVFAGKEVSGARNRLGNLIEALMLDDGTKSQDYLLAQVELYLKQQEGKLDWSKLPRVVTDRGEWLTVLLGLAGKEWTHRRYAAENPYRKPHPQLEEKEKEMILKALPELRGLVLAETVHALHETGASTPKQLLPLLKEPQSKDEFALGVLWWARRRIGPFAAAEKDGKALEGLEQMNSVATQPQLKMQIAEAIQYARTWQSGFVGGLRAGTNSGSEMIFRPRVKPGD